MRSFSASIWIVVLSMAALACVAWGLVVLFAPARPPSVASRAAAPGSPAPVPELVTGHAGSQGQPGRPGADRGHQAEQQVATALLAAVRAVDVATARTEIVPTSSAPAAAPLPPSSRDATAAGDPLLDRIFAPERLQAETTAAVQMEANRPAIATTDGDRAKEDPAVASRTGTEKAYYEEYRALGAKDAEALQRRAAAIIGGQAEDCMKVAMLRALYDTDPAQATGQFLRAITSLPDTPRTTGVSVPVFAVNFLAERAGDPQIRRTLEQLVWSGSTGLSPALQRQAADALVASASPADLQRYGSSPVLQEAVAAARKE